MLPYLDRPIAPSHPNTASQPWTAASSQPQLKGHVRDRASRWTLREIQQLRQPQHPGPGDNPPAVPGSGPVPGTVLPPGAGGAQRPSGSPCGQGSEDASETVAGLGQAVGLPGASCRHQVVVDELSQRRINAGPVAVRYDDAGQGPRAGLLAGFEYPQDRRGVPAGEQGETVLAVLDRGRGRVRLLQKAVAHPAISGRWQYGKQIRAALGQRPGSRLVSRRPRRLHRRSS